ncbi:TPA: hypothetical protein KLD73_001269 [Legionella pneumophila]|nr:hypothetical protein [Legionella pneumophila]MDW8952337.1 hypothetical protein [Legionella pneumophila]MDX1838945.1 hypothetical protein [Legionella pneumophila]QGK67142.1 hypothetical protein GJD98_10330 [Legionella pneumophila]CZR26516.1 Uncharacterised protein [Legionella pneumophila]HAT7037252.1 hypothetical protein [Legionella pneumophila]
MDYRCSVGVDYCFMIYFRKKKKTTRFYMILIISLAILAIFLHGASFQLH